VCIDKGILPNNVVALHDTTIHCERQPTIPPFQPPKPLDCIPPSCSYNFLLDYSDSSYSHPFNQLSFKGMSYPSLHPVMIIVHLDASDALGVIWFLITPSLLASSCKNDGSDKRVVNASCDFEYCIVVASEHIFIVEKYSLKETPLETLGMSRLSRSCHMIWNLLIQSVSSLYQNQFAPLSSCPVHYCFTLFYGPLNVHGPWLREYWA